MRRKINPQAKIIHFLRIQPTKLTSKRKWSKFIIEQ